MKKMESKKKLTFLIVFLSVFIVSYIISIGYHLYSLKRYEEEYLPGTYLGEFDMTCYSFEKSKDKIHFYEDYILSQKVEVMIYQEKHELPLKDLGASIDVEKTIQQVKDYQKKMSFAKKVKAMNRPEKQVFPILYQIDEDVMRSYLTSLKGQVDIESIPSYFDTREGVVYVPATDGFSFNVEKAVEYFTEQLQEGNIHDLEFSESVIQVKGSPEYEKIDTMTSSFVTNFMPDTYLRNINLNNALSLINGTIVEPGEVFSYCDRAGPFDRKGYVFYYEFVGNGVCQIATTTYNAALLGGLEIVKRYPHAKKSLYVDGGLDATVASYSSGWCADMQFKNTYSYPIFIKAYSENSRAHVEFWSNHDAKGGYEYTTSSQKIGVRGYRTYLHTWKDGVEVDVHEIATTWYSEE